MQTLYPPHSEKKMMNNAKPEINWHVFLNLFKLHCILYTSKKDVMCWQQMWRLFLKLCHLHIDNYDHIVHKVAFDFKELVNSWRWVSFTFDTGKSKDFKVISAAENSKKFQKTRFCKEKSVEEVVTLGPTAQATLVIMICQSETGIKRQIIFTTIFWPQWSNTH